MSAGSLVSVDPATGKLLYNPISTAGINMKISFLNKNLTNTPEKIRENSNIEAQKALDGMARRTTGRGGAVPIKGPQNTPIIDASTEEYLTRFLDTTQFNTEAMIALVDSRHDFKTFSQDSPHQKKNKPLDFFTGFSNNIQRFVLKLDKSYSKFTASTLQCRSIRLNPLLGNDPESEFRKLFEKIYVNIADKTEDNPLKIVKRYDIIKVKTELTTDDDYKIYHAKIYKELCEKMGIKYEERTPIPVIVDTTGTLDKSPETLSQIFEVCRPKECVADPSNTSKRKFARLITEDGSAERTYDINGISYKVYGESYESPSIDFTIPSERASETFTYQFDKTIVRKPNEIEMCKSRINDTVTQIVNLKEEKTKIIDTIYAPGTDEGSLDALVTGDKKTHYCANYDTIPYNEVLKSNFPQIALPYIAKRAGDQLQVLACLQEISYNLEDGTKGKRKNCIFWSQDIMAVCFAIMNGVTSVFQDLPTKTVTAYVVDDYKPIITNGTAGGMRGGACTRSQLEATLLNKKIITGIKDDADQCYNMLMEEMIDVHSPNFNSFIALDFMYYYSKKHMSADDTNPFHQIVERVEKNYFTISLSDIFTNRAPFPVQPGEGKLYVIHIDKPGPNIFISVFKESKAHNYTFHTHLKDKSSVTISVSTASLVSEGVLQRDLIVKEEGARAGGATPLETRWERSLTGASDDTLFMDFLQMLTVCEDEYFRHQDYTDSIYIYDPAADVRIGGHVQTRMMCFLEALVESYKLNIQQGREVVFAPIFKYFPTLLKQKGEYAILSDLDIFIQCWFEDFKFPFATALPPQFTTNTIYKQIFDGLMAEVDKKYASVRALIKGTDTEIARYLSSVFPHGYFTISMNAIKVAKEKAAAEASAPNVRRNRFAVTRKKMGTIANVRSNQGPLRPGMVGVNVSGKAATARRARRTVKNRRQRKARSHA